MTAYWKLQDSERKRPFTPHTPTSNHFSLTSLVPFPRFANGVLMVAFKLRSMRQRKTSPKSFQSEWNRIPATIG